MSTSTKAAEVGEIADAAERLRGYFPPGSTVHTVLRHVARSGMTRHISVIVGQEDGSITDVSHLVAKVTGRKLGTQHSGINCGGVGMDMGFELTYALARALYRVGFPCTGKAEWPERCPSNDHTNEREPNFTPGRVHSDPGYALNHRWV